MTDNKKGLKISNAISAALISCIILCTYAYYASLISMGYYIMDGSHIFNIVTGLLLSTAPMTSLMIINVIVLRTRSIGTVEVMQVLTIVVHLIFLFICLGKDLAFLMVGAMSFMGEVVNYALEVLLWHILSIIPMIMTAVSCSKIKKSGILNN